MKQILKWAGLVLLAAAVGLAFAFISTAGIRRQTPYTSTYSRPFSGQNGYGGWGMMGPGMMGRGYQANGGQYSGSIALTLDQAIEAANSYLAAYGNADLSIAEVMEFTENFYADVEEKSSGRHASELLIDRSTGAVYPEIGPNMMWNTKYGHMGSMMEGRGSGQAGSAPLTAEKALELAQKWLDQYLPGTSVGAKADAFYGYYTIHVLKDGKMYGMLSVNDYTGDVWYHTWHGNFIQMKELEEQ